MRPVRQLVERIIIVVLACFVSTGLIAPALALDARPAEAERRRSP